MSLLEKAQLPVPIDRRTFTLWGQTYVVFVYAKGTYYASKGTFDEGEGVSLKEAIATERIMESEGMKMVTFGDTCLMENDTEANRALYKALKLDECGFVRFPELEERGWAACLIRGRDEWFVVLGKYSKPNQAPARRRILVFRCTGGEATAQKANPESLARKADSEEIPEYVSEYR